MNEKKIQTSDVKESIILSYIHLFSEVLNENKKVNIKDISYYLTFEDNISDEKIKEIIKYDDKRITEYTINKTNMKSFKGYVKKSNYNNILTYKRDKLVNRESNPNQDQEQLDIENAYITIRNNEVLLFKKVFEILFKTNKDIIKIYENKNVNIDEKLKLIKSILHKNKNDKNLLKQFENIIKTYKKLKPFALSVRTKNYKWNETEFVSAHYLKNMKLLDEDFSDLSTYLDPSLNYDFYYDFCNNK